MDEELLQRIEFGKQAELFWSSRLGEYLRDRNTECYNTALEQLKIANPHDAQRIQHLQNEIHKSTTFESWISDVIMDGIKSLQLLEEGNDE